jgi:O-antigen/teichoic acid export membrane protein
MPEPPQNGKAASTRATIGIFLTKIAIFPLSFLVTVSIVHDLGQADYGKFSFLNVLLGFSLPLFSLGFGQGVTYLISSTRFRVEEAQFLVLLLGVAFGLATALVLFGLWHLGALAAIRDAPPRLVLLTLAVLPVQGMNMMLYRLSMGASWFTVMNMVDLAKFTITPLLLILFVITLGWSLPGAVYALVGRELLIFLLTAGMIWSRVPLRVAFPKGFLRQGGTYGIKAWIGDLTVVAYSRLDHFLLGSIATDRVYAVYNIATKVTELLWLPTNSLGPVLFNRIARVKDGQARIDLTARIHRIVILVVATAAIGLALVTPWLVPWVFGAENAATVVPVLILIPGTLALVTQKILTKYFGGCGRPEKSSLTTVLGTVAIAALSVMLIPVLGASGAALASTAGYVTMAAAAIGLYKGMIRPQPLNLFIPHRDDIAWAHSRVMEALEAWRSKLDRWRRPAA